MEIVSISSGDEQGNLLNDDLLKPSCDGPMPPGCLVGSSDDTISPTDSLSGFISLHTGGPSAYSLPQHPSLSTISLAPPITEDESRLRKTSSKAVATSFPPLFGDTKWIHFTVEHSLSYEYPLTQMLPYNHKVSFRVISKPRSSPIIRHTLFAHGFAEVDEIKGGMATSVASATPPTLTWSCSGIRVDHVRHFKGHQKINHFIKMQSITRKDHLCENIERMQLLKGIKHFDITPKTFVLPKEMTEFQEVHKRIGGTWILKPAALSRGRGISLINHPRQVNVKELTVISRYIDNPFCINGLKFDLRLYVLITSIDPLRIYLYEEGLGRFASVPYTRDPNYMRNLSMHLTNYSLNKDHSDYVVSSDPDRDDVGNKWSSSAIFRYLRNQGCNVDKLLASIEDVIIKTIIAGEIQISTGLRFQPYHGNCFELLGFDILLDSNLKPWVLEVNLSPSLHCDTPLDLKIKSKLVADTFSLVGVTLPVKYAARGSTNRHFAPDPYHKFRIGSKFEESSILVQTKEEHRRRGGFVRIFPTSETWDLYSSFLENRTKLNYLLHRNLYPENGRIKWPASSVGASIDGSVRLRNSMTSDARQHSAKVSSRQPSNAAGLDLVARLRVYLNGLSLESGSLSATIGYQTFCGKLSKKHGFNSDQHFDCIVSVYVSKLIEELLQMMDPDKYNVHSSLSTEKLLNSIVSFLKSTAKVNHPVLPDQFLSLPIRFRMIAQQLKEFLLSYNATINSKSDGDFENVKSFLEKSPIADIESLIIGHNSSDPFLQYLVDLVKCMKNYRIITVEPSKSFYRPPSAITKIRTTITSAKSTKNLKQSVKKSTNGKKYKTSVVRPQFVSPAPSPSLTAVPSRRYCAYEDHIPESKLFTCSSPYKSIPSKVKSVDSGLSKDTAKVISAAFHRLSSKRQLVPPKRK